MSCCRAIEDTHHAAAPTATHQAGQQRAATTCGFAIGSLLHVSVFADHPLVLLELFPTDVAGMMVANQDAPLRHWLLVPSGPLGSSVHDGGALGRPSKHVGAS